MCSSAHQKENWRSPGCRLRRAEASCPSGYGLCGWGRRKGTLGKHHHPHWEGWRSQDEVKEIKRNRFKIQIFKWVPLGNKNIHYCFYNSYNFLLSQLCMLYCQTCFNRETIWHCNKMSWKYPKPVWAELTYPTPSPYFLVYGWSWNSVPWTLIFWTSHFWLCINFLDMSIPDLMDITVSI